MSLRNKDCQPVAARFTFQPLETVTKPVARPYGISAKKQPGELRWWGRNHCNPTSGCYGAYSTPCSNGTQFSRNPAAFWKQSSEKGLPAAFGAGTS